MIIRKCRIKDFVLLLVLVLGMLALAGCGKNAPEASAPGASTPGPSYPTEAETFTQADTKPDEAVPEETTQSETVQLENTDTVSEHADTLVVYFSATGHTEPLAKYAAEYLNADIYEIVPETAYTNADLNYNDSSSRSSKEQNDSAARPAIAETLPDISGYDTIIIGHPIWWGQAPKIIYTFLESYDWSGKTLVTFCTSASSGLGSSAENLKPSASGNPNWLESRRFPIGAEKDDVIEWLSTCQVQ